MVENLVRPTPGALVAMQQIADWLKTLGMSEYTDRFVENRIDLSVLPDLTDQELEKLVHHHLQADRPKPAALGRASGDACCTGAAMAAEHDRQ
jgi:SAM domain (Sterile alpha motif)